MLKNKRIAFVLYDYPLGVSTMIINTISLLIENNNYVIVITNTDQHKNLPVEKWLQELIIPAVKPDDIYILNLIRRVYNKIFRILRSLFQIREKIKSWEQKNHGIDFFSSQLGTLLNKHGIEVIMAVECFSLIAADRALCYSTIKPKLIYFDMELLDWAPENPLYSDKLELKTRQFDALKKTDHAVITSFNRAKLFTSINSYPEQNISVLPVVPRERKNLVRSDYFRRKFNIPDNKLIVLYSGNFMPWAMCIETIGTVSTWPVNAALVMHTWNKDSLKTKYFKDMEKAAEGMPVYFSSDCLSYDDLGKALSSADIGLMFYADIDDNFTEICFSSNKMGEYIASGMPILCSPYPSLQKFVDDEKIGFSIPVEEIGTAINSISENMDFYRKNVKDCCQKYKFKI